jgi:hypothetical protein
MLRKSRRHRLLTAIFLSAALVPLAPGPARAEGPTSPWSAWSFLLGEWEGKGQGGPGQGSGSFAFALDLHDTVVVRRNHSEYPAADKRPAVVHDDLMVCYHEADGKKVRAEYWDSEGHAIHYGAELSADGKTLVFVSDPQPQAPSFRLTYTKRDDGSLGIRFEIAPPGKADAFTTYLEGSAARKGSPAAHP